MFGEQLTAVAQFDLVYVDLALRRYRELNSTFLRLGLDLPIDNMMLADGRL